MVQKMLTKGDKVIVVANERAGVVMGTRDGKVVVFMYDTRRNIRVPESALRATGERAY